MSGRSKRKMTIKTDEWDKWGCSLLLNFQEYISDREYGRWLKIQIPIHIFCVVYIQCFINSITETGATQ